VTLAGLIFHGGRMADEITVRARYLIAEAWLIATAELRKRHGGQSSNAADMERLLWSFFTRDELLSFA